jgi:hypothetical protein
MLQLFCKGDRHAVTTIVSELLGRCGCCCDGCNLGIDRGRCPAGPSGTARPFGTASRSAAAALRAEAAPAPRIRLGAGTMGLEPPSLAVGLGARPLEPPALVAARPQEELGPVERLRCTGACATCGTRRAHWRVQSTPKYAARAQRVRSENTAGEGMRALPNRRRNTHVSPAMIGRVSQATRKAQATRDASNNSVF